MYYEIDTGISVFCYIVIFHIFIMNYLSVKSPVMQVVKRISTLLATIIAVKIIGIVGGNQERCLAIASFLLVNLPPLLYLLIRVYITKRKEENSYIIKLFLPSMLIFLAAVIGIAMNKLEIRQLYIAESISASLYVFMMAYQVFKNRKKIPLKEVVIILAGVTTPFVLYIFFKVIGIDTLLVTYATPISIIIMLIYFGDRFIEVEPNTKTLRKKPFEVFMEENYKKNTNGKYTIMILIIKNMYTDEKTEKDIKLYNRLFARALNEILSNSEKLIYNDRSEYILFSKKTKTEEIDEILKTIESKIRINNNRSKEEYKIEYEIAYQVSDNDSYNDVRRKAYIKAMDKIRKVGELVE